MSVPAYPHPIIAREGWNFIIAFALLTLFFSLFSWFFTVIGAALTIFTVQFFRDPARESGSDDEADVLSPADGRVIVVENTTDPYRNDAPSLKISVFMNVFNVHSNRSPVSGTVEATDYFSGSFVNAALDKASESNERNAVLMRTVTGHNITFVQIAGLVARRIICYAKEGDKLSRGERYGLIRFGSRVDIYLPPAAQAKVAIGDKVKATSSVLAHLPE